MSDESSGNTVWRRLGRSWYRPRTFAALLALAVIGANHRVVFFGETFGLRDFSIFGYPLALQLQESLRAGELPLWNILSECGHPFLAQWNTMALYPPMLLTALFPLGPALAIFCLVHQYLGGLGMYFLARRWARSGPGAALAGVLYTFDGIMQTALMWPNNIAALGLLPWVILAVQSGWRLGGRAMLGAALLSGLQLLTGAPEMIVFTWLLVLLALGHEFKCAGEERKPMLRRCGTVIGLAALLAAVQLLPFFDLMANSERVETGGHVTSHVEWYGWANFFLPFFECLGWERYGGIIHASQIWTHSYYLGYAPWLLLGWALFRNRNDFPRNLAACAVFALIFALGPDGRLYRWADAILPIEWMRYPVKFMTFAKIAMPLLAAWGLRRLSMPRSRKVLWITIGAVSALIGLAIWMQYNLRLPREGAELARWNIPIRLGWFAATAVALLCVLCLSGKGRRVALLGVVVLSAADLLLHQPQLSPTVHPGYYQTELKRARELTSARHPDGRAMPSLEAVESQVYGPLHVLPRIIPDMRTWLAHNANLIDRVPLVGGFYSLHLPRYRRIYYEMFPDYTNLNEGLANFLGITHTTKGSRVPKWVVRTNAQSLITVGRQPVFLDEGEVLNRLTAGEFNAGKEVLFDGSLANAITADAAPEAQVTVLRHDPHVVEFTVNSPAPTVATVAQTHYHWWRAEVDGTPMDIHRANYAFQGVAVPAGEHRVVLRYVDQGFRLGALLSLLTLLGILVGWWRCGFYSKRTLAR